MARGRARRLYTFRCPCCGKYFRQDEPGEPLCTGPNESADDHPPVLMRRVRVARPVNPGTHYREVDPATAEALAEGPLLFPYADWIDPDVARAIAGLNAFVEGGPL
jgi:hypothetical protein